MSNVRIPNDLSLTSRYDQRLLDGVVVLEGTLLAQSQGDWTGKLYREIERPELRPINVKFIPYSVWQNRGKSEMSVWLPRVP